MMKLAVDVLSSRSFSFILVAPSPFGPADHFGGGAVAAGPYRRVHGGFQLARWHAGSYLSEPQHVTVETKGAAPIMRAIMIDSHPLSHCVIELLPSTKQAGGKTMSASDSW